MTVKKYTAQEVKNLKLTPNFSAKEFACNHCNELILSDELVQKLQLFREQIGSPIQITSGYRCPYWNKHEGGSSASLHTKGTAVDINLYDKFNGVEILNKAVKIFNRVGFYQSSRTGYCYMHVDVSPQKLYWLSRKVRGQNKYEYFNNMDMLHARMRNDSSIQWYKLLI